MTRTARAALVTGASRGIGLAIAEALAREGFALTISARTPESLDAAADRLRALGADVLTVPADASDPDGLDALLGAHEQAYARLDALVLNAGMGFASPIADTPLRRLDRHIALNLRGTFALVSAAIPLLRRTAAAETSEPAEPSASAGASAAFEASTASPDPASALGARVIAIASLAALMPEPGLAAYGATKAAVVSLCETLCAEESAAGVSATAICPGYVDTDMAAWKHDEIPPEGMIRASDLAELAVSLTRLSRHAVVPVIGVHRAGDLRGA